MMSATEKAKPATEANVTEAPAGHAADEAEDTARLTQEERTQRSEKIIKDHVLLGVASGLIPGPAVDMAVAFGVQLAMLKRLSTLYGVPFTRNLAKGAVTSLLASVGGVGVGAIAAVSAIKVVPGLGTAVGVAGSSVSLGAFTYAVGKVFAQHFESGGTFIDLNPRAYRDYFRDMRKRGKKMASDAVAEEKTVSDTSRRTPRGATAAAQA
jgi:uncharacterized protein (DUF697 family)